MCNKPPEGWYCTREPGHVGPCACREKYPISDLHRLILATNFQPGDIIELEGHGYIHWVPEEEAIPNRVLREIRQREIRRVIEFTKRKYS